MANTSTDSLFPPIEPFAQGFLPMQDGHEVYFEQCGNPQGLPVIFVHGGPGSGCSARHRQLFNPASTRAILFDQRGCGRSKAQNPLQHNTTANLLADMERLRLHLGIDQWLVVGGSWGAGLGLAYASQHRHACLAAVLRGVFLCRPADLHWFFHGAQMCMPDAWHALAPHIPAAHREHLGAYLMDQVLTQPDDVALPLVQAWQAWENALTLRRWTPNNSNTLPAQEAKDLLHKYRLQSHYLQHGCFFPSQGLLSDTSALHDLPMHLLHGRLDWICLPEAAWAVHQMHAHSRLQWIDHAGHNPFEAPFAQAMVQAIEDAVQAAS